MPPTNPSTPTQPTPHAPHPGPEGATGYSRGWSEAQPVDPDRLHVFCPGRGYGDRRLPDHFNTDRLVPKPPLLQTSAEVLLQSRNSLIYFFRSPAPRYKASTEITIRRMKILRARHSHCGGHHAAKNFQTVSKSLPLQAIE